MAPPVPELDPEWLQLVEPTLPQIPSSLTVQTLRQMMGNLDATKVQALNDAMPDLKRGLEITNIMVAMRDGVERQMRIFRPETAVSLPVYLGWDFLKSIALELLTFFVWQVSRRWLVYREQRLRRAH
jgi:predicted acyl esterase